MDKISKYREIRRKTMMTCAKIKFDEERVRSFVNVFKYNKVTNNEGAVQYALHFLGIDDEMCEVDKYMEMIGKDHPDYEILQKMKQGFTSYFKIVAVHNGYLTIIDLNTNRQYDVYDINHSAQGDCNIGKIIYSTIIEIDDIYFFAGYDVALLKVTEDNYKGEIARHKKRIKLTTNPELIELVAAMQLSKGISLYVTV